MVNIGTDIKESEKVVEISQNYKKGVYASIGLHPLHIKEENFKETLPEYEKLAKNPKVVAIGETGLDRKGEEIETQKKVFIEHIELAKKLDLPLILHCRKAHKEVIEILKSQDNGQKSAVPASPAGGNGQWTPFGVIHCFTGGKKELKEYMDLGFYIGLNGIIFKINLGKEIREIPLGRILLETDCPFLTPPPEKGRNEPIFTKRIAKEVARVKGVSVEEVERVTTESARKLFRIQQ